MSNFHDVPCDSPTPHRAAARARSTPLNTALSVILWAWVSTSGAAAQEPVPLLTDSASFLIATDALNGSMTGNSLGEAAVVWEDPAGIGGRVWNADGSVRIEEIRLRPMAFPETSPSVGLNDAGELVVGWVRNTSVFPPATFRLLYRRFDGSGDPAGDVITALPFLGWGAAGLTPVHLEEDGAVIVLGAGVTESDYGVVLREFDAEDEPMGEAALVGGGLPSFPYSIRRLVAPGGESLVVWGSLIDEGPGWRELRLEGRFFDAQGGPLGGPFEIADPAAGFGAAWHSSAGYLVVWNRPAGEVVGGGNPAPFSIRGRMVSPQGLGPELVIKAEEDGELSGNFFQLWSLAVAVDPEGGSLVLWSQELPALGGEFGIFGQRLAPDLGLLGDRFSLQQPSGTSRLQPMAVATGPGRFFLAWSRSAGRGSTTEMRGLRLRFPETGAPAPTPGNGSGISVLTAAGRAFGPKGSATAKSPIRLDTFKGLFAGS